jgi:hypothetical protein
MSIRDLRGGKGRPARKAEKIKAICEPIVYKIWEPRRLKPYGPPGLVTGIALPLPFFISYIFDGCDNPQQNYLHINTVNHRYNGMLAGGDSASAITDVRYNRVQRYSRKYTIGYTANTSNIHRNTQIYDINFLYWDTFILNSFLTTRAGVAQSE